MKNFLIVLVAFIALSLYAEIKDGFGPTVFESMILILIVYGRLEQEGGGDDTTN